jgi:hypothetical protein
VSPILFPRQSRTLFRTWWRVRSRSSHVLFCVLSAGYVARVRASFARCRDVSRYVFRPA